MLMPAGHHYSRQELEHLKRSEIQKLCKDYGLRANMKTETLVDELLETIRSNIAPLVPPPPPPQQAGPVTRRASTRSRTSSRSTAIKTRGSSGSSFTASEATDTLVGTTDGTWSGTDSFGSLNATGSRVRKAKDSQYRLGVGRPAAAGGSGARSVTRSSSKNRKNRMSRSVKLVEETIQEEQEVIHQPSPSVAPVDPGLLYPQVAPVETPQPPQMQTPPATHYTEAEMLTRIVNLETHIQSLELPQHFDTVQSILNEIGWLKQVIQNQHMEINSMKADIQSCRLEIQGLKHDASKITFLENQVSALRESMAYGRATFGNSAPGTPGLKGGIPRRVSIPLGESNTNTGTPQRPAVSSNPSDENLAPTVAFTPASNPVTPPPSRPNPTVPPSTLGKRQRDSTGSEFTDGLEGNEDPDSNLARRVLRPNKKKAKLAEPETTSSQQGSDGNADGMNDAASTASGPSTVPPIGTPPPSTHLPDYFADTVDASHHDDDGAVSKAGPFGTQEGFYPFTFGGGASSTPRSGDYSAFGADFSLGSVVKTPAQRGPSGTGLAPQAFSMRRVSSLAARPRTPARLTGQDRFKSTTANNNGNGGNNNNSSAAQQQQQQPQQTMDYPHADSFAFQIDDDAYGTLDFTANREAAAQPNPMSMNLHFGIGFGMMPDDGGSSPIQNVQKTMYGTELANDTRFGDFGRDGVASTSGKNMFWWN
ncbi:hypothetical protein SCHPADRAFT_991905 [Schizopora paradoxa]|uniref:Uncharacterized protein n=1 Tax=Schizopora paradoxa TaxID=27342 RepID=A0A0H2SFI1_9AGAM|nr:hypothetical protein SCHPADRAFT_991905 [Schizopora paradoxa]